MSVVQTERLSDKLKEISANLPETKVLERKLETMVRMEPEMEKTLAKVKKAAALPSIAELQAKTDAIKIAAKGIEKATDGAKEVSKPVAEEATAPAEAAEEAAPKEASPKELKTAAKKNKSVKLVANGLHVNKDFKKNVMEQASAVLQDQIQNNIAVSSKTTVQNGNRICQADEDEAFDNCVKPAARDADADDEEDIKTANQQMGSREYRDANLDLLARS